MSSASEHSGRSRRGHPARAVDSAAISRSACAKAMSSSARRLPCGGPGSEEGLRRRVSLAVCDSPKSSREAWAAGCLSLSGKWRPDLLNQQCGILTPRTPRGSAARRHPARNSTSMCRALSVMMHSASASEARAASFRSATWTPACRSRSMTVGCIEAAMEAFATVYRAELKAVSASTSWWRGRQYEKPGGPAKTAAASSGWPRNDA